VFRFTSQRVSHSYQPHHDHHHLLVWLDIRYTAIAQPYRLLLTHGLIFRGYELSNLGRDAIRTEMDSFFLTGFAQGSGPIFLTTVNEASAADPLERKFILGTTNSVA
jgi:hypothetical protein